MNSQLLFLSKGVVLFYLNCLKWLTFILMDPCHCYQVHFGDKVTHSESCALRHSYQALGPIPRTLKHKTAHKTDKQNTRNIQQHKGHYITILTALYTPPTPHSDASVLTQRQGGHGQTTAEPTLHPALRWSVVACDSYEL